MKGVVWLTFFLFAGMAAFGQRADGSGRGAGGHRGAAPIPPGHPNARISETPDSRFGGSRGSGRFIGPYGYPLLLGDYAYPPNYPATPTLVITPPAPVYAVDEPAPAPRSEIREYKSTEAPAASATEQPTFSIALKDGSVRSAVAVFVQGNMVAYVDPDGRQERVPGDAVDRDATKRLNQGLKVNLYLPPPSR